MAPDERAEWESHCARLLRERDAARAETERLRGVLDEAALRGSVCCEYHAESFERALGSEIDVRDREIAEAHRLTAAALAERDREVGRNALLLEQLAEARARAASAETALRVQARHLEEVETLVGRAYPRGR